MVVARFRRVCGQHTYLDAGWIHVVENTRLVVEVRGRMQMLDARCWMQMQMLMLSARCRARVRGHASI